MRKKPNVIVCLCDQMRAFESSCYGHPIVRTPNMARMASEGAIFETAVSNCPLCVPARSLLLTGQYARTCTGTTSNFVGFPPNRARVRCTDPTLPEVMREAEYRTMLIGKWHLHPAPHLVGFEEACFPHNLHIHYGQSFYDLDGNRTVVEDFAPHFEIEQVRRFLKRRKDEPFFLYYSISPPHMPLNIAPRHYTEMYSRDDVILRENAINGGRMAYDPRWFRLYLWDYLGYLLDPLQQKEILMSEDYEERNRERPLHGMKHLVEQVVDLMKDSAVGEVMRERFPFLDENLLRDFDLKDLTALYYGMVTCVDDRVGELLDSLEEAGLTEDTLVVFTSDHGDNLGSRNLWNKANVIEESIRIPLIFRWPGRIPPQRIKHRIGSLIDVMPTALSLAGLEIPGTVQGEDLRKAIEGGIDEDGENRIYIEAYRREIAVRTGTHLYGIPMEGEDEANWIPSSDPKKHMFYDLDKDPFELHNLASSEADDPAAVELRNSLLEWHRTTPRKKIV